MFTIAIAIPSTGRLIRTSTPDRTAAYAMFALVRRGPGRIVRLWHNGQLVA
jgi:hypothetical protein